MYQRYENNDYDKIMEENQRMMVNYQKQKENDENQNCTLFFGTDCLKFIYKSRENVKGDLKILHEAFIGEIVDGNFKSSELLDYDKLTSDEFTVQLAEALNIKQCIMPPSG
jgi:hypothetical protein